MSPARRLVLSILPVGLSTFALGAALSLARPSDEARPAPAAPSRTLCTCPTQTLAEQFAEAEAVFHGWAVGKDDLSVEGQPYWLVEFEVERMFKGENRERMRVRTAAGEAACGVAFETGKAYLVFAELEGAGDATYWITGLCSGTSPFSEARADAIARAARGESPSQATLEPGIGLPLFLPLVGSGMNLARPQSSPARPTAAAPTEIVTQPAPGTPWVITATPGPTWTPWIITATPPGERTNTPRPTEAERTNTPRPTEADRTNTPPPTEAPKPSPGAGDVVEAQGPRLFKSGPIQITADGRWVWVADAHANSVSRIDTESGERRSFKTSDSPGGDNLKGISVMEDGSEAWATAHDTDRVYVVGSGGELRATVQLPWGCGPYGIALSPPQEGRQRWALVSCHRAEALIAIDTQSRETTRLAPVFRSPYGVAWTSATEAWVTHLYPDDEHPHLSAVSFTGAAPRVSTHLWFFAASPRDPGKLTDADATRNVAEGGYVNFRGHPARFPGDKAQLWIPSQYHNMHPDRFTPDSTIQASLRRFDLGSHKLSADDKVVLTAKQVHDATRGDANPPWIGHGWNASVSGLVDVGFTRVGGRLYTALVAEQSDELLVMPADTLPYRSKTDPQAPGLPELRVGKRPMGVAMHPTRALAYTYNSYSFDVSEVNLGRPGQPSERRRIAVADAQAWSPIALKTTRDGGALFYTSADPRVSANEKVSCASCHVNAEHDGRSWAFHQLPAGSAGQGHGQRNVQSLLGLGLTFTAGQKDARYGYGQLHHSGDRDEIQDFDHTFKSPLMGGTGFLGAALQPELGAANAGRSAELDGMAAYLMNLKALPRSPYRDSGGDLSEAAVRGAASFLGASPETKPADADCAGCHVPETAFLDHAFHDIGQRRDANEKELNDAGRRARCLWCTNTASLVGAWDTAPHDGVAGYAFGLAAVIEDLGKPGRTAPHGSVEQLSGRQRADLEAFVGSIDGSMSPPDVRSLRDRSAPRIARVSVTSLTRVEVWFTEAVDRVAVADAASWTLTRQRDGGSVPVTRAVFDPQNGDRVSLYAALAVGEAYRLQVAGAIRDLADQASGGVANILDRAAEVNRPRFEVGESLTITLGASGYENLTIPVHDSSPVGPGLATWSHDRLQLGMNGDNPVPGFVRFEWQAAMTAATGLTVDDALLDAGFSAEAWAGDAQSVEIRRVLQPWSDPAAGGDWSQDPVGGPTWRDHSHPSAPWKRAGASALGGTGARVQDYDAEWDLAEQVDQTLALGAVNGRAAFGGDRVAQAFRFWLEHPDKDYGYALRLVGGPAHPFLSFKRWEEERRGHGPVLTLRYRPR